MKRTLKAEITVFLTMLFGVVLIFIYALIESSTLSAWKSYERGNAQLAISSVFAEYNTTLWEEYHIFAVDATYETGVYDVENLKDRLEFYDMEGMDWEVTQLQLLSDGDGAAFEEQILDYMQTKYGIDAFENLWGTTEQWENTRIEGEDILQEAENIETENIETENTETDLDLNLWDFDILTLVLPNSNTLSPNSISSDTLPSNRNLEEGIACYELSSENAMVNKILIGEYIFEHFASATDIMEEEDEDTSEALLYEMEYILIGEYSDADNLQGVVNQILLLRIPINYTCLLQSTVKMAEINALALTMATAMGAPLMQEAMEQALLLAWSYGESILDIRSLLSGNKIPIVKTTSDWQLDLSGIFTLGTATENSEIGDDATTGLSYEDYLRVLLYLTEKDQLIEGALDMVEMNMQMNLGASYFQVDTCVTQLQYWNISETSSGYSYEFPVTFTYR